jgi:hypothetical protein
MSHARPLTAIRNWFEVSCKVLEETGLTIGDMDQIVTNSQDFWDGRTISNRR